MFLQHDSNGGHSNGYSPEDQFVPGKDVSKFSLECYYCNEWGHVSNDFHQIPPNRGHGGGGGRGEGASTGGRSGTGMLHIHVFFAQNADGMIPSSWILLDTCLTSSV